MSRYVETMKMNTKGRSIRRRLERGEYSSTFIPFNSSVTINGSSSASSLFMPSASTSGNSSVFNQPLNTQLGRSVFAEIMKNSAEKLLFGGQLMNKIRYIQDSILENMTLSGEPTELVLKSYAKERVNAFLCLQGFLQNTYNRACLDIFLFEESSVKDLFDQGMALHPGIKAIKKSLCYLPLHYVLPSTYCESEPLLEAFKEREIDYEKEFAFFLKINPARARGVIKAIKEARARIIEQIQKLIDSEKKALSICESTGVGRDMLKTHTFEILQELIDQTPTHPDYLKISRPYVDAYVGIEYFLIKKASENPNYIKDANAELEIEAASNKLNKTLLDKIQDKKALVAGMVDLFSASIELEMTEMLDGYDSSVEAEIQRLREEKAKGEPSDIEEKQGPSKSQRFKAACLGGDLKALKELVKENKRYTVSARELYWAVKGEYFPVISFLLHLRGISVLDRFVEKQGQLSASSKAEARSPLDLAVMSGKKKLLEKLINSKTVNLDQALIDQLLLLAPIGEVSEWLKERAEQIREAKEKKEKQEQEDAMRVILKAGSERIKAIKKELQAAEDKSSVDSSQGKKQSPRQYFEDLKKAPSKSIDKQVSKIRSLLTDLMTDAEKLADLPLQAQIKFQLDTLAVLEKNHSELMIQAEKIVKQFAANKQKDPTDFRKDHMKKMKKLNSLEDELERLDQLVEKKKTEVKALMVEDTGEDNLGSGEECKSDLSPSLERTPAEFGFAPASHFFSPLPLKIISRSATEAKELKESYLTILNTLVSYNGFNVPHDSKRAGGPDSVNYHKEVRDLKEMHIYALLFEVKRYLEKQEQDPCDLVYGLGLERKLLRQYLSQVNGVLGMTFDKLNVHVLHHQVRTFVSSFIEAVMSENTQDLEASDFYKQMSKPVADLSDETKRFFRWGLGLSRISINKYQDKGPSGMAASAQAMVNYYQGLLVTNEPMESAKPEMNYISMSFEIK